MVSKGSNGTGNWTKSQNKMIRKFITRVIGFIDVASVWKGSEKPENTAFVPLVKWI